jgi:hypothetical protein
VTTFARVGRISASVAGRTEAGSTVVAAEPAGARRRGNIVLIGRNTNRARRRHHIGDPWRENDESSRVVALAAVETRFVCAVDVGLAAASGAAPRSWRAARSVHRLEGRPDPVQETAAITDREGASGYRGLLRICLRRGTTG